MNVRIEKSWNDVLADEWDKPYFAALADFVHREYRNGPVFPPASKIFAAFDACPFGDVKVVILGQDPYHGPGQANGLCFSVAPDVAVPRSLVNIFKEVHDDTGAPIPANGDLRSTIAERYADSACPCGRFTSESRMGAAYRCRDSSTE